MDFQLIRASFVDFLVNKRSTENHNDVMVLRTSVGSFEGKLHRGPRRGDGWRSWKGMRHEAHGDDSNTLRICPPEKRSENERKKQSCWVCVIAFKFVLLFVRESLARCHHREKAHEVDLHPQTRMLLQSHYERIWDSLDSQTFPFLALTTTTVRQQPPLSHFCWK